MSQAETVRQLRAMGLEPMRLRRHASAPDNHGEPESAAHEAAADRHAPEGTTAERTAERCLYLWFPSDEGDPFSGEHARLLGNIIKALGVDASELRLGVPPEDASTAPVLAFGFGAPAGAVKLPALGKLRSALEKRIAWAQLRPLRQRLQREA